MNSTFINNLSSISNNYREKKYLLTVSGGKDSIAMVHLFANNHLQFDIAHCNFHLREEDSDRDQHFVEKIAEKYHVRCYVKEFDTIKEQQNSGQSIEMIARKLRYEWFNKIGKNYDYIVTAHQANDNAETLLLNISRGTGLKGLVSIPVINGKIIRPLLNITTDEILKYIADNKLSYCDDYTNHENIYQRNKIRNAIIPELKKVNESIISILNNNIKNWTKQYKFYEYQIINSINKYLHKEENYDYLVIEELMSEPFKELILYELLIQYNFSEGCIKDIINGLRSSSGKKFYSKNYLLLKERERLIITKQEFTTCENIVYQSFEELNNKEYKVEKIENPENIKFEKNNNVIYIDAHKIEFPIIIRSWKTGDYFYPFGMKGKMKLSDYFNNNKIDNYKKNKIKVMCSQKGIIWLVGYRADNRYKIDFQNTKVVYKITYLNLENC